MRIVTSGAGSRLRIPQFCQPLVENTQVNWTETWQTLPSSIPCLWRECKWTACQRSHTHSQRSLHFIKIRPSHPALMRIFWEKITVNQFTKILSYSSSLPSQIKDLSCAADKHCALYFRCSLLVSTLIAASHLLWPLLKGGSTSNCTWREMSASDLSEQFLPQVI